MIQRSWKISIISSKQFPKSSHERVFLKKKKHSFIKMRAPNILSSLFPLLNNVRINYKTWYSSCLLAYWMSGTKARREVAIRASCRRLFNLIFVHDNSSGFPASFVTHPPIRSVNSRCLLELGRPSRRCDAKSRDEIWSERSRDD